MYRHSAEGVVATGDMKRGNRMTLYGKFALAIMLGASAALGSQSPPKAADATKVGYIEVPTLGPAQDPLGLETSATEFPCGGLRPVADTATTEGAQHAYAIPNRNSHGSSFAIYADIGTLGEGSVALAEALGIQVRCAPWWRAWRNSLSNFFPARAICSLG